MVYFLIQLSTALTRALPRRPRSLGRSIRAMAQTPAKLNRMMAAVRSLSTGRRAELGQQEQGLARQHAEVHRHPARVDGHADHVVGIQRAQHEHDAQTEEGSHRCADGPPPLDEEVVHNAVAHGTGQHGPQAVGGLFVDNVCAVEELVEAAAGGSQRQEGHKVPGVVVVGLHHVHDRAAEPDDARCTAEQHRGIGAEDLGKEPGAALLLGHGGELPGIVEDQPSVVRMVGRK